MFVDVGGESRILVEHSLEVGTNESSFPNVDGIVIVTADGVECVGSYLRPENEHSRNQLILARGGFDDSSDVANLGDVAFVSHLAIEGVKFLVGDALLEKIYGGFDSTLFLSKSVNDLQ